jgi:hypothetical protein
MVFISPNKVNNKNTINNSKNLNNSEQKTNKKVIGSYEEIKKQVEENSEQPILNTKKSNNKINTPIKKININLN